ncbi:hypothetical protein MKX01_001922, partial [Papaver californicum]
MLPVNEDCFYGKEVMLEPLPITVLPPEPIMFVEEIETELNHMLVDPLEPADANPTSPHDPV